MSAEKNKIILFFFSINVNFPLLWLYTKEKSVGIFWHFFLVPHSKPYNMGICKSRVALVLADCSQAQLTITASWSEASPCQLMVRRFSSMHLIGKSHTRCTIEAALTCPLLLLPLQAALKTTSTPAPFKQVSHLSNFLSAVSDAGMDLYQGDICKPAKLSTSERFALHALGFSCEHVEGQGAPTKWSCFISQV